MLPGVTKGYKVYHAVTKMLHLHIMLFLARTIPTILLFNKNIQNERFSIHKDVSLVVLNDLYPSLKVCILTPSLIMCHKKSDKRRNHCVELIKCCDERTQYVSELLWTFMSCRCHIAERFY
eukprot:466072_1